MGDAEGEFDAVGINDVLILNEDGLSSFRAEVSDRVRVVCICGCSHLGLEHEVELLWLGELAGLVLAFRKGGFLFARRDVVKLVGAVTLLTNLTVYHGIGKSADVTGCGEDGVVGEDGSIEAEDIVTLLDVFTPPEVFEVALHFSSEGAVVPATVQAAVDFGRLENESFAFAQGDDLLHAGGVGLVFVGHGSKGEWFPRGP